MINLSIGIRNGRRRYGITCARYVILGTFDFMQFSRHAEELLDEVRREECGEGEWINYYVDAKDGDGEIGFFMENGLFFSHTDDFETFLRLALETSDVDEYDVQEAVLMLKRVKNDGPEALVQCLQSIFCTDQYQDDNPNGLDLQKYVLLNVPIRVLQRRVQIYLGVVDGIPA